MKTLKFILLSSMLLAGASAIASGTDCPQVNSGNQITRDDAYTNPKTTQFVHNVVAPKPAPALIRNGSGSNATN
jgi:hypothetical protein